MQKKTISAVVLTLLLLCIGVIVHAAPLPLVPGMTQETTAKQTEQKTQQKSENTTQATTKQSAPKTPKSDAPAAAENDSKPISKLEERAKSWFAAEQKEESSIDKLAFAAESTGNDYLARMGSAKDALLSKAKAIGEYGAESYRAAVDTLFGWDYTMNKGGK